MLVLRVKNLLLFLLCCCCAAGYVFGEEVSSDPPPFHLPYVAGVFHDIAFDILAGPMANNEDIDLGMAFLTAAGKLDTQSPFINETMLRASPLLLDGKYDTSILHAFDEYTAGAVDLEVAKKAIMHLLDGFNSRQQREDFLTGLLRKVDGRNQMLSSEISMHLGFLAAEKGDLTMSSPAVKYFRNAVRDDQYNFQAFSSLHEMYTNAGESMSPSMYARYLRLKMTSNPMDLGSALNFARYCESSGMYDVASQAYEYSVKLYKYLNGKSSFEMSIYLSWSLCSYHSNHHQSKCLEILNEIRRAQVFDIRFEAIAGRAAIKMSDKELGIRILTSAGRVAEGKLKTPTAVSHEVTDLQLAWFYNFIFINAEKAMPWAERAFSRHPNSADVKAMFCNALVRNASNGDQGKAKLIRAKKILMEGNEKPLYETNQIAAVAMGIVLLKEGNVSDAKQTLRMAVEMDELSFIAGLAKLMLEDINDEYKSSAGSRSIAKTLEMLFPNGIVPDFVIAEDVFSATLELEDGDFAIGAKTEAALVISNLWTEPMVIFDDGLFKGNIRIDAQVRGDVQANIYELVSKKIQPGYPIKAGGHLRLPLKLMTGSLRRILQAYPQASVDIKFTVYLDPIVDEKGELKSSLNSVGQIVKTVKRSGVDLNKKYLMNRLTDLSNGSFEQKINAGRLFAGLFSEQYANTGLQSRYSFVSVDRSLVVSAIRKNLSDDDWKVKAAAISFLLDFRPPMDFEITKVVSQDLNDPEWPVRLAALYMLYKTQGDTFMRVVGWKAKNDENLNVRRIGEVLVECRKIK